MNTTINDTTTFAELIKSLGNVTREPKTPTLRHLRENGGEPVIATETCAVYANGYAVYTNVSGATVMWLPDCAAPHCDTVKPKGCEQFAVDVDIDIPDDVFRSMPWEIAVTLCGDYRIENNRYNNAGRRGVGSGTDRCDDTGGESPGDVSFETVEAEANRYEKPRRKKEEVRVGASRYPDPETVTIQRMEIREALSLLTDAQREAFVLSNLYGYTQREIGGMLHINQKAVDFRLAGAEKKFQKL